MFIVVDIDIAGKYHLKSQDYVHIPIMPKFITKFFITNIQFQEFSKFSQKWHCPRSITSMT